MLFSIVTITRNNRAGLARTRQSLRAQAFTDCEWIVVDGASTDGSLDDLVSERAQVISEPDHGIYDAMNKGLAAARGTYTLFLNAGDVLAVDDTLARLAQVCTAHPDLIYGDGIEDGFIKPARPHDRKPGGMFTYHQAILYRTALAAPLHYDTQYKLCADYKFTMQVLAQARRVVYWPHPVCIYESGGVSQQQAKTARRELAAIRRELRLCGPLRNAMIMAIQTASFALRQQNPALYRRLRGIKA